MSEGRIPRFYVDAELRAGEPARLPEEAAHHAAHVLRLRETDPLVLFNGRGGEYPARVAAIGKRHLDVEVLSHDPVERESPLQAVLVQGVSAADRMDFTIQKAVELGVAAIQPVIAERCVTRLKGERAEARVAHWQRVAISACEQSGRNRVPPVLPLMDLDALRPPEAGARLLLSPRGTRSLAAWAKEGDRTVMLAAGPEAGFSYDEERRLERKGFLPLTLGPRTLRTETAAPAALAALNALLGDF